MDKTAKRVSVNSGADKKMSFQVLDDIQEEESVGESQMVKKKGASMIGGDGLADGGESPDLTKQSAVFQLSIKSFNINNAKNSLAKDIPTYMDA